MTAEQFRGMLHQQPFLPFTIRMTDGRAFEVAHRDFVAMSPTGGTIIVYQDDENFSVLDLLLMSELQVTNGYQSFFFRKVYTACNPATLIRRATAVWS